MGEILTALAGTFIASAIILAIAFAVTKANFRGDEAFDIILRFSAGSTILYWLIELFVRYQFTQNAYKVSRDQLEGFWWGHMIVASILFIGIGTIILWVLTIAMAIVGKPDNFMEFLVVLFKSFMVALLLGIFLRFVSGFTTNWVKDFAKPKQTFFQPANTQLLSMSRNDYV